MRHERKRRALLGYHHYVFEPREYLGVELAEKLYRVEVFFAAVLVGSPLLAGVVEIKHARNRVHP